MCGWVTGWWRASIRSVEVIVHSARRHDSARYRWRDSAVGWVRVVAWCIHILGVIGGDKGAGIDKLTKIVVRRRLPGECAIIVI